MRTSAIALIAGLGVAFSATAALADYPESPIEVIIPYGAGGNSDTSGRILINAMRDVMGADFVPLNVTGAGGTVGTAQLAGSDPDGYTLGYNPIATVTVQPHLRPVPYNNESFAPVCMIADNPTSVTVAPDSPYESIDDLIAAGKPIDHALEELSAALADLPSASALRGRLQGYVDDLADAAGSPFLTNQHAAELRLKFVDARLDERANGRVPRVVGRKIAQHDGPARPFGRRGAAALLGQGMQESLPAVDRALGRRTRRRVRRLRR